MWVITKEVLTCSLTGRPAVALGFYSRLVCIFEGRKTLFLSRLPSPKVRVGKGFSRVMTRPAGRVRRVSKCRGLFVWIVSAITVTKVVDGCVYIRRRYDGILPRVGGEFEHSALSPISLALSSKPTTLNHLIRLRGSQGIQIWEQRTH